MTLKQYRNLIEKKIILSHESSLLEKQIKENDSRIEKICQKINISKNNIKYIVKILLVETPLCTGVICTMLNAPFLETFKLFLPPMYSLAGIINLILYTLEKINQSSYNKEIQILEIAKQIPENEKAIKQKELEKVLYEINALSEEEKKEFETALERLRIEETLMEMKYELGESLYNFKLQQQRIEEKYQKENLEQERLNLITQKGINQESLNEVFQKQLQLAYRLGMKDIPNDISKTYREEEIQHCEEVLGLKIERKKE